LEGFRRFEFFFGKRFLENKQMINFNKFFLAKGLARDRPSVVKRFERLGFAGGKETRFFGTDGSQAKAEGPEVGLMEKIQSARNFKSSWVKRLIGNGNPLNIRRAPKILISKTVPRQIQDESKSSAAEKIVLWGSPKKIRNFRNRWRNRHAEKCRHPSEARANFQVRQQLPLAD
jgi:hypothetical protein